MNDKMIYRNLGSSELSASIVGLGAFAIGGWPYGGTEEKKSIEAIQTSIDMGVNLIDTAPMYGFGRSEEIVGKAIKGKRDKVIIATKCGMVWDRKDGVFQTYADEKGPSKTPAKYEVYRNLKPDSIRSEIEKSLKRLDTDYIDLYQTHWQDSTTPIDVTMDALNKLKDEGKIRAIGVSNVNLDQLKEYGNVVSAQERYTLLDRTLEENGILEYCVNNNIAILSYFTLERGLLTGKMSPDRIFKEGDTRKNNPQFTSENIKKINTMLEPFKQIAEKYNASIAQIAITLTGSRRGITHMLIGARDAEQARENAKGGYIQLSEEDRKRLIEVVDDYIAENT